MEKNFYVKFGGFQTLPQIVSRPTKMDENDRKLPFLDIFAFSSAFLD